MKSTVVDEGLSTTTTRVLFQRKTTKITSRDSKMRNQHKMSAYVCMSYVPLCIQYMYVCIYMCKSIMKFLYHSGSNRILLKYGMYCICNTYICIKYCLFGGNISFCKWLWSSRNHILNILHLEATFVLSHLWSLKHSLFRIHILLCKCLWSVKW